MKKTVVFIVIVSIFIVFALFWFKKQITKPEDTTYRQNDSEIFLSVTANPTFVPPENLTSSEYKTAWIIVRDIDKLQLFLNLEEQLSSKDALSEKGCAHLVSGGFWGEDNKPLGLVISEGERKSEISKSELLNGYFYVDSNDSAYISPAAPQASSARLALQSGPILMSNGKPVNLSLKRDENARRLAVATTENNEVVFIVIYYKPSPIVGPKLAELPQILNDLQKNTNLKFTDVLNLDGGAHSAFITDFLSLVEVARFGTFFCIKP